MKKWHGLLKRRNRVTEEGLPIIPTRTRFKWWVKEKVFRRKPERTIQRLYAAVQRYQESRLKKKGSGKLYDIFVDNFCNPPTQEIFHFFFPVRALSQSTDFIIDKERLRGSVRQYFNGQPTDAQLHDLLVKIQNAKIDLMDSSKRLQKFTFALTPTPKYYEMASDVRHELATTRATIYLLVEALESEIYRMLKRGGKTSFL